MATIKALTKAQADRFKKLGRQDKPDAEVVAKFFLPTHGFYWFFTELETDPESEDYGIGFGYANLADPQCAELGTIDLFELLSLNRRGRSLDRTRDRLIDIRIGGPEACFGVVERDIHWSPRPLNEVIDLIQNDKHVA